jgi:hypothetical protein
MALGGNVPGKPQRGPRAHHFGPTQAGVAPRPGQRTGGRFLWLDGADSPSTSAAIILPACPRRTLPNPNEEREKEARRRQAAKLARLDHQEARALPRDR